MFHRNIWLNLHLIFPRVPEHCRMKMLPKLFRFRKRTWTLLKYSLFLVAACGFVIWLKIGSQPGLQAEHLNQNGLEIKDKIIADETRNKDKNSDGNDKEVVAHPVVPPKIDTSQDKSVYDQQIREDEEKLEKQLGRGGLAVRLSGREEKEAEEIMKKEAFNLLISDRIPYNRSLPGT